MSKLEIALVALGILALVIIAFFAVFRGKGKFRIKTKLGEASAEGENPAPSSHVASGVKIKGAQAGRNVVAESTGTGGVDLEQVKAATGDITASHHPGDSPPKTKPPA